MQNAYLLHKTSFRKNVRTYMGYFLKLKYPEKLVNSAINHFQYPTDPVQTPSDSHIRIALPFKDQKSADLVRRQLGHLGTKTNQQLQPVFTSKKTTDHPRVTGEKPPLINQQTVVYKFICDSCDTNYIGYKVKNDHRSKFSKLSNWKEEA